MEEQGRFEAGFREGWRDGRDQLTEGELLEAYAQAGTLSDFCEFMAIAVSECPFPVDTPQAERYTRAFIPSILAVIAHEAARVEEKVEAVFNLCSSPGPL